MIGSFDPPFTNEVDAVMGTESNTEPAWAMSCRAAWGSGSCGMGPIFGEQFVDVYRGTVVQRRRFWTNTQIPNIKYIMPVSL